MIFTCKTFEGSWKISGTIFSIQGVKYKNYYYEDWLKNVGTVSTHTGIYIYEIIESESDNFL